MRYWLPTKEKPKHVPREGGHRFEYPLASAGFGKKDVMRLAEKHGLLNPVYDWRSNVSCFCCPFQRKGDWLGMLRHHPTLYRVTEEWEARCAETSRVKKATWPMDYSVRRLRCADEAQMRLWPETKAEPCLICTV